MKTLVLRINALSIFDIKDDVIVKSICDIICKDEFTAFTSYGNVCRELALCNIDLSMYLHNLIVYKNSTLLENLINNNSSELDKLLDYDLSVINELSRLDGDRLKILLIERFGDHALSLPSLKSGVFDYEKSYFIEKARCGETGIFAEYKTFIFKSGNLNPVLNPDTVKLSDLKEYETQKQRIKENTDIFVSGKKAQNVLLYGDRGTGKSSTVKALVNHYDKLRIIGVEKYNIPALPELFNILRKSVCRFIIFLDDLTFEAGDDNYNLLKQILEGSLDVVPENVLIYATTNRCHIIKETVSDRDRDVFHRGDALDDNVSLFDRFGLFITYSLPDKILYMKIINWLAKEKNIIIPHERLEKEAEVYALKKGGRSPRIARQFIDIISNEIN